MMNLQIFDSLDDLSRAAAREIERRVAAGARTIALSGGSTPRQLYELLGASQPLRETPLTWVEVDERYVPVDDPQSNAGMIERTLFAQRIAPAHRFIRFRTELGDPAATARAFADECPSSLDIVILGMGDDGHTASLFPGTTALAVEDRMATEVWVEKLNAWRVTMTKPLLRAAAYRMVLATGAAKKPLIAAVRDGADYPIAQVTGGVETWWFIDRAAAP